MLLQKMKIGIQLMLQWPLKRSRKFRKFSDHKQAT